MKPPVHSAPPTRSCRPWRGALFLACAGLSLLAVPLHAGPMPRNLGNGLDALVDSNVKVKTGKAVASSRFNGYATARAANVALHSIHDLSGRVLVRVQPNGIIPLTALQAAARAAAPGMVIKSTNTTYHRAGVFEAYVSLDDVPALAALEGVSAVKLSLRPIHAAIGGEKLNPAGTVYDFGVTQHRVDQINTFYNPLATLDYEGRGISVGVLSTSFDANPFASTTAAQDVASGDLPGTNSTYDFKPITVLEDFIPGFGSDEGRAMCQTVFKMATKVRLGFATADLGEVDFANNILALAGLNPGYYPDSVQQGFAADVLVDDVSYFDEPFFQDGILAQAVQTVTDNGVSYFSSAGNSPGTNGYDSDFRFVANGTGLTAATNTALAGTNINLAGVPAALYAGGFHNFNPNGLDVAQTVNYPDAATVLAETGASNPIPTILQWNDPTDTTVPTPTGAPIFTGTGTITYNSTTMAGNEVSFPVTLAAGQQYYVAERPSTSPTTPGLLPLDGIVTVVDPNGNVISQTDNNSFGGSEFALFVASAAGTYTIYVDAFEEPAFGYVTDGSFTLSVSLSNTVPGNPAGVTQDLNLLVFDMNGNFLPDDSSANDNFANNAPIEITQFVAPDGTSQVQFVISRTTPPAAGVRTANHLRYLCDGDGVTPLGPSEYFSYLTPVTSGHSCAAGANGVAAYSFYRPSIPEGYTSPGPATIYFDADGNALPTPQVRLKPDVAAMDGANTTFFGGGDSREDLDTAPNFFGTSDAAPHAAAIAALVLEAHGGKRSVTPAQMKSVLQRSAFVHDLDPFFSSGVARTTANGKVSVSISSDDESDDLGTVGANDPNSISVSYVGPGSLATFVLNPGGTAATAGNTSGGNNGLTPQGVYFTNPTPGLVFSLGTPFALGNSSPGLTTATVIPTPMNAATMPSNAVMDALYFTQKLTFRNQVFTTGKTLHFTIGRYLYQFSDVTTPGGRSIPEASADLFGGAVRLPNGATDLNGMSFSGTTTSGATFSGFIQNRLGAGYSALDGFGFINAQTAVSLPLQ